MLKVYIAGPDVFFPNGEQFIAIKAKLCQEFGFEPLVPGDSKFKNPTSKLIKDTNIGYMRDAHIGTFNFTPYPENSADPGTAWEAGFMSAMNKPVYTYSNCSLTLNERYKMLDIARRGFLIENFGHIENLMLSAGVFEAKPKFNMGYFGLDTFAQTMMQIQKDFPQQLEQEQAA